VKVQGTVKRTQTIEGSISKAELLALVRETMNIPEGASAVFYVNDYRPNPAQLMGQYGGMASSTAHIDESAPLKFTITWSLPVGKDEQG
jgi:hypothetical protein